MSEPENHDLLVIVATVQGITLVDFDAGQEAQAYEFADKQAGTKGFSGRVVITQVIRDINQMSHMERDTTGDLNLQSPLGCPG
jgi:hypothetical protein